MLARVALSRLRRRRAALRQVALQYCCGRPLPRLTGSRRPHAAHAAAASISRINPPCQLRAQGTVTGDSSWLTGVQMSVAWFLGDNDAKIPLFDERTGGGCDGLSSNTRNRNQGAESTLAMISVMQHSLCLTPAAQ